MRKAGLVLLLLSTSLPAWAGLAVGGRTVRGEHGYREQSLNGELKIKPKFDWDDPDIPQPFTAFSFRLGRTGFKRDGADGATYTTRGGVGAALFGHATLDFDYAVTPELSESSAAYRSRVWTLAASGWWDGWVPDMESVGAPSALETKIAGHIGRATHEERIQISTQPFEWRELGEDIVGGSVSQTYWKITTLRLFGQSHSYDRDLRQAFSKREFLPVSETRASASYGLLQGFAKADWGASLSQDIGRHLTLGADWTRTSYEIGLTPRSDTTGYTATLVLGLYVDLHGRYEAFKPEGGSQSTYTGFGVGVGF